MLIRSFISISISERVTERLLIPLKELREMKVQSVPPKNLHLTLKFLGDVKPDKIERTKELLEEIPVMPFTVNIKGIGFFPSVRYVKIIFAGVKSEGLQILSNKINEKLKPLFPVENFLGHLTLARVNKKYNLSSFYSKYSNTSFGSMKVNSFSLMSSLLVKGGPIYSQLWGSEEQFSK